MDNAKQQHEPQENEIETIVLATLVQTSHQVLSKESLENYITANLYRIQRKYIHMNGIGQVWATKLM